MGGQRSKARVAGGLQFDSSLTNVLGVDAIGVWNFEEGAGSTVLVDSSGYGNDCTGVKNVSWLADTPKGEGLSLVFDNADEWARPCGDSSLSSPLNLTDNFTISLWVKPSSFSANTTAQHRLINRMGWPDSGYYLYLRYNGQIRFGGFNSGAELYVTSNSSLGVGQWSHIAVTYLAGEAKIYLNGKLDEAGTTGPIDGCSATALEINADWLNADFTFFGAIDDLKIYSRAMTSSEIKKQYAGEFEKYKYAEK